MSRVRIDKWLWAARFFKTRSLATHACDLGRVTLNGQTVKPAREVHPGDQLAIRNTMGDYHVEVLALSEVRGPAPAAQALYHEPEESREARHHAAAERKAAAGETSFFPKGRPGKKDRRDINRLRGRA
ncbi:MAG: RNA-binding S4 domain-containing protein [Bryobacterales bacterium]|nr:RNA-binding S4 domain-containing protein [Bryobacterales bacterium]